MTDEEINKLVQDCVTGVVIATISISAVILFQRFDLVSDEASLGDLATFGSIIAAAWIASRGWKRADQNAQDERQRLAMADATILHHKLKQVSEETIRLLLDLMTPADQGVAQLFGDLDERAKRKPWIVSQIYTALEGVSDKFIESFSDTSGFYESIRSLFVAERIFGGHVVKVLSRIDAVKTGLTNYRYKTSEHRSENFEQNSKIEKEFFFDFLADIAAVLVGMEVLRRKLKNVKFNPGQPNAVLLDLERQLSIVLGNENFVPSVKIGPDEYLDMLCVAGTHFEKKGSGVEQSAFSKQSWSD